MSGFSMHDNDDLPTTAVSEARIAEEAPAALANLRRRGQATGDLVAMLGLDGWVAR